MKRNRAHIVYRAISYYPYRIISSYNFYVLIKTNTAEDLSGGGVKLASVTRILNADVSNWKRCSRGRNRLPSDNVTSHLRAVLTGYYCQNSTRSHTLFTRNSEFVWSDDTAAARCLIAPQQSSECRRLQQANCLINSRVDLDMCHDVYPLSEHSSVPSPRRLTSARIDFPRQQFAPFSKKNRMYRSEEVTSWMNYFYVCRIGSTIRYDTRESVYDYIILTCFLFSLWSSFAPVQHTYLPQAGTGRCSDAHCSHRVRVDRGLCRVGLGRFVIWGGAGRVNRNGSDMELL